MGLIRLILALSVVIGHAEVPLLGFHGVGSSQAVTLFFMISGFYMALVLNTEYAAPADNLRFYANRILRLYPTYAIGVALGLLANRYVFSEFLNHALDGASIWDVIFYVTANLFIVGQDLAYIIYRNPTAMSLDSPAWSVAVELLFYAVAPFVLRSPLKTAAFLAVGVAYHIGIAIWMKECVSFLGGLLGRPIGDHILWYYASPASIMFFGLGAMAYHCAEHLRRGRPIALSWYATGAAIIIATSYIPILSPWWGVAGFAAAIPLLFALTKSNTVDRYIGELSYPVYILHYPILMCLKPWLGGGHPMLAVVLAAVCIAVSMVIVRWVEKPIDRYRHGLRFAASEPKARVAPV